MSKVEIIKELEEIVSYFEEDGRLQSMEENGY